MKTLLLNKSNVYSLLDLDKILTAVENGYKSFQLQKVVQPDFMSVVLPGTHTGFDFKAGMDLTGNYVTIKSSSGGYPDNPSLGLPTGMNVVYLYEASTSALKCILDGTYITGCRTAAAGAISIKYLARKNASSLAIMGSGNQARHQLRAALRVHPFKKISVWSYDFNHAATFAREMSRELSLDIKPCSSAKEAVSSADVIITTTRGRKGPIIRQEWLKAGTHIAAIGSDMPDKQELDTSILKNAKVVADSKNLCMKNGELHHAVESNVLTADKIHAEIGEIILGLKPGRENDEEITVFDTVGMAIQDNVMAAYLYQEAEKRGMGIYFDFLN